MEGVCVLEVRAMWRLAHEELLGELLDLKRVGAEG